MNMTYILAGALAVAMGVTGATADARDRGGPDRERASFSELDADGNGEVTRAEMEAFAAARFAAVDIDGDGSLSAEELVAARSADNADRMERRINRFLERADDNGNGKLELEEMGPSEERATARFERLDTDGSGGISEAEMEAAKEGRKGRRDGDDG
ncbi:MAG: EF-hand domain-containing protein [Pseudomonadota bacterium]